METKLRQVTDSIHGTIYLSTLESDLISTPYFYRLHDIYQSSTVYMTYPSNRTKRYEHSLGTMELASSMLFSAVSNADNQTRNALFMKLKSYFEKIYELAIVQSENQVAPYFTKYREKINSVFNGIDFYEQDMEADLNQIVDKKIKNAVLAGCFVDSALDHFQFYPMEIDRATETNDIHNLFLYRCLLQAVRIVALFHDVGHPPYSHIIEEVLEELYDKCIRDDSEKNWNKKKIDKLKSCLSPYATDDEENAYVCQTLYSQSSLVSSKLHERIGLSMLQSAFNDVIPEEISSIADSSKKNSCKIASILYYIMVVELTIAILVEKDIFFKSFHKIVDGTLDSDRLDYIMRDSLNSGVDWGKIPYKRLVNSAKLVYLSNHDTDELEEYDRPFVIAYPKKVADDIEDLLLIRYKIFARINFHHRCMKTAVALQSAVLTLAEDYLTAPDDKQCINPDINILWTALGMSIGNRNARIIQWNDSWLISVLHKALVQINARNDSKLKSLKEDLEEILLNKKRYYALFKRGVDSQRFVKKVFNYAEITEERIEALLKKECRKYYVNIDSKDSEEELLTSPKLDAIDSIQRVKNLLRVKKAGDVELLCTLVPLEEKNVRETIDDVLIELKHKNIVADYKIIINHGRGKMGIPSHKDLLEEIYLFNGNDCFVFDETVTLQPQVKAIEKTVLWLYVYFIPINNIETIRIIAEKILDEMAKEVGKGLKKRYEELFGKGIATERMY